MTIQSVNSSFLGVETSKRIQLCLLAAITLLAGAMRFYKLGAFSFWIDELYTIRDATAAVGNSGLRPLSFALTGVALNLLGITEWTARLPSALIGVISIPILYFPTRKIFGPAVALLAAIFMAVSLWHLYWSQNARFYTTLMLFFFLALWSFYCALEEGRARHFLLSMLFLALAIWERTFALGFLPIALGYLVLLLILPFGRVPGFRLKYLVPVFSFLMVLILYLLFFRDRGMAQATEAREIATEFFGLTRDPFRVLGSIAYWLGVPTLCMALFGGVYLLLERQRIGLLLLVAVLAPLVALLLLAPFARVEAKYALGLSLPCWLILAAVGTKQLMSQMKGHGTVLSLGVLCVLLADPLSQDMLYYSYQNGNRPDWRAAFSFVQQHKDDTDMVVTTRTELGQYYLNEKVFWSRWLGTKEAITRNIVQSGRRVWFVIDDRSPNFYPPLDDWLKSHSRLVAVRDVHIPGRTFTLRVYRYDPPESRSLESGLKTQTAVRPLHP